MPPKGCPAEPLELARDAAADERCLNWQTAGLSATDRTSYSSRQRGRRPRRAGALGYQLDDAAAAGAGPGGVLLPTPALVDDTGHASW